MSAKRRFGDRRDGRKLRIKTDDRWLPVNNKEEIIQNKE